MEDKKTQTQTIALKTPRGLGGEPGGGTHLWYGAHFVHLPDELAVGLVEQQQLEMQLVQPLAELQLLQRGGAEEDSCHSSFCQSGEKRRAHTASLRCKEP